jgi:hypothetical protein
MPHSERHSEEQFSGLAPESRPIRSASILRRQYFREHGQQALCFLLHRLTAIFNSACDIDPAVT